MKKILLFASCPLLLLLLSPAKTEAQGVGINSTGAAPNAATMLHVDVGNSTAKGLLVTGSTLDQQGTVPDLGEGTRLMFYPSKAAFRVGYAGSVQWDNNNVGFSSMALGYSVTASGLYSYATGFSSIASGNVSTAMGRTTTASGLSSVAMGNLTTASGNYSTAMGTYVSTNGFDGSFIIGDQSTNTTVNSNSTHQMTMRFANGYRLFTNAAATTGVSVSAGGGPWGTISDVHKKENFMAINTESILQKVAALPLSRWNYKSQPASQQHIGPMAQDFYAAFALDGKGNDTTINTGDIDGVNMAAIQALEKRTADLKSENEGLKASLEQLQKKLAAQQQLIERILEATKPAQKTSAATTND